MKITFLLFISQQLFSQSFDGYEWKTLTTKGEPKERHEAAFIEADGKFYLVGGRRIQEVSIFDPKNNSWTSGAKPPIEIHHFQGFSYKGNIYVVGAHAGRRYPHEKPSTHTYIYHPKTDTWSKGFNLPEGRLRGSTTASVYKNKLYIAGGILDGHWDGHVKWFDCYDFKTGKWEKLPDAPRARDHATSVICNNKLYMIGGRISSGKIKKVLDLTIPEVDVYDFKTATWSTLETQVPTQRAGATAICVGNKILFAGGESMSQVSAHKEIDCLDTETNTWSTLPSLIQGRHGTQLIWDKKKLYIASGCSKRGGGSEITSIECFTK
ncbi:Kelch repeat-containing protein [Polaribacter sp. Asnod1-A03]|uniref:Kelch repeat-containing protein n=1 Tax=Polaribacter sp. Asnod1-A03 TaxID=3160581 RepID=UPI00386AAFAA